MEANPIRKRAEGLGISVNKLAWRSGFTQPTVSEILNAHKPLTVNVALGLAGPLNSDNLALVVANALWRKGRGITLNNMEKAFIEAATTITGLSRAQLQEVSNAGLYYLERALNPAPSAPPVVLAGEDDDGAAASRARSLEFNKARVEREATEEVPDPPAIVLREDDGR